MCPRRRRWLVAPSFAVAPALLAASCGGAPSVARAATASPASVPAPPPEATALPLRRFSFESLDGRPFSSDAFRGRTTVLGLAATYDVASQAQARFLSALHRDHVPRLNVGLLVLEPPENRPLVEAFARALRLRYPVALADAATVAGRGPLGDLHHVPSVVILDAEGRELWRHVGLATVERIEAALRRHER